MNFRHLLLLLALMVLASNAKAASSDTLALQGSLAAVNSIAVTPSGSYSALNITGGESNTTLASVAETSNDLRGYTISMSSTNAGELKNTSDGTKKTSYTISYDGASASAPAVAPQTVKTVSSLAGLTTNTSAVKINVTAYATAPAGTYSDTITFAVVGN